MCSLLVGLAWATPIQSKLEDIIVFKISKDSKSTCILDYVCFDVKLFLMIFFFQLKTFSRKIYCFLMFGCILENSLVYTSATLSSMICKYKH